MSNWLVREDLEKMRRGFLDSIDPYTDYIESYSQMKQAKKRNTKYSNLASFCRELLVNYDEVLSELKSNNIDTKLEYCKGYFRICINGVYKYKKCNVVYKD